MAFLLTNYQDILTEVTQLRKSGELKASILRYVGQLESDARNPYLYFFLGVANFRLHQYQRAIKRLNESLSLDSSSQLTHYFLSLSYEAQGIHFRALRHCDAALAIDFQNENLLSLKGRLLYKLKLFDKAVNVFNKVIALNPSNVEAYNNLGVALRYLNRPLEAIKYCSQAIVLKPNFSAAYYNRGNAYKDMQLMEEAHQDYQKAIDIAPSNAQALLGQGLLYLLEGEYSKGWELYEWRYKNLEHAHQYRDFNQPRLTKNTLLRAKRILVCAEQGAGDLLQFCRYIPMLLDAGAEVFLEAPEKLHSILRSITSDQKLKILIKGMELPTFDYFIPIASLPLFFGTLLDTIPAETPYLHVSDLQKKQWVNPLLTESKLRVGLAWSGSATHDNDLNRSVPLNQFSQLLSLPVEFHSIQVEYRSEDLDFLQRSKIIDHSGNIDTFADTAAIIEHMDLVITVDTSVAHLAGALGKDVWIMLPFIPDFRWLLDRADSPWYPTARLFRQKQIGDWNSVVVDLIDHLQSYRNTE